MSPFPACRSSLLIRWSGRPSGSTRDDRKRGQVPGTLQGSHREWVHPLDNVISRAPGNRETLELLGKNPRSLSGRLDWAIKRHFYERWIRTRDFTCESINDWNAVVAKLSEMVDGSNIAGLSAKDVLTRRGPYRSAVSKLESFVRSRGLSWDGLEPFLNLRAELFELDMRFSELGAHGLFRLMDEASELDHRLEDIGDLEPLRTDPLTDSRAAVRGSLIRRSSQERSRYRCGWNGIWDIQIRRLPGAVPK